MLQIYSQRILTRVTLAMSALTPVLVHAQDNDPVTGPVDADLFVNGTNAALFPLTTTTEGLGRVIFVRGIRYALLIVGIMSISFIIYSAIQLSTAAGDEAKVEQAKKALLWSVVGTVIVMILFLIIGATQNAAQPGGIELE